VWNHFNKEGDDVVCKCCPPEEKETEGTLKWERTTTTLANHLKAKHALCPEDQTAVFLFSRLFPQGNKPFPG